MLDLTTDAVESTPLPLESVDTVHGSVGDSVSGHATHGMTTFSTPHGKPLNSSELSRTSI
jgi:hypothetical protein